MTAAVPCAGGTTIVIDAGLSVPPVLVSLARTLIVTFWSAWSVTVSLAATGAGCTRTLTAARFDGAHRGIVLSGRVLIECRAIVGAKAVLIDDEDVQGTVLDECPDGHGSAIATVGRRGNVDRRDVGERVCGAIVEIDRADRRVRGRR